MVWFICFVVTTGSSCQSYWLPAHRYIRGWICKISIALLSFTPYPFLFTYEILIPQSDLIWCDVNKVILVGQVVIWFSLMACLDYFSLWSIFFKNAESHQMIKVARSIVDACVVNKLYMIEISSLSYPCIVL